ncbi:MAG: nucleotide exchange factor GrpE [Candidatus Andersenbacteria bacterium]
MKPDTKTTSKPSAPDKAAEYLAGWQRAKADYENLRKRTDEQRLTLVKTATRDLLEQLLPVLDNLERTLAHKNAAGATDDSFVTGVELVVAQLHEVLAGQGVTVVRAKGQPFDPALHEAIAQVEGPAGVCVDEHAPGYKLHDVVLRPARVSVGKAKLAAP